MDHHTGQFQKVPDLAFRQFVANVPITDYPCHRVKVSDAVASDAIGHDRKKNVAWVDRGPRCAIAGCFANTLKIESVEWWAVVADLERDKRSIDTRKISIAQERIRLVNSRSRSEWNSDDVKFIIGHKVNNTSRQEVDKSIPIVNEASRWRGIQSVLACDDLLIDTADPSHLGNGTQCCNCRCLHSDCTLDGRCLPYFIGSCKTQLLTSHQSICLRCCSGCASCEKVVDYAIALTSIGWFLNFFCNVINICAFHKTSNSV